MMLKGHAGQRGFTLIELLIVVVVVGILAAIAMPAFQNYVRESRRAEAQATLLDIQQRQERWRVNNPTYGTLAAIGGTASSTYYTFTVSGNTATAYTITATATGAQTGDTGCTSMTLNQDGARSPLACWKS